MWIIVSLLIISLSGVYPKPNVTAMRWVDNIEEDDMDITFDRAVIITVSKEEKTLEHPSPGIALGVFVSNDTVLTSYNPFRMYINSSSNRDLFTISVLSNRTITNWKDVTYDLANYSLVCGRQVFPTTDNESIWHNDKKEHSPLHDLMVLRLNTGVGFLDPDPKLYSFDKYGKQGTSTVQTGPLQTDIATPHHKIGRDMKFASLGFIDKTHMIKFIEMRSHTFTADDNVLVSCDDWLPRQWGIFLCIKNINKTRKRFKGLGSGALLFQNYTLFGIGCFMLKKGKSSILVFTDVRPYYHLINETCSWEDQNLQNRTTTTTSTTTTTTITPDPSGK